MLLESNDQLKEIDIENRKRYYFDDISKFEDFDLDNILRDEKSYKSILVYNISSKVLIGATPLRIRFNKIDGVIRVYEGIRSLVLFGAEKHDSIYNRIRYFIGVKRSIIYVFFIIMQESRLIDTVLCLQKKIDFS